MLLLVEKNLRWFICFVSFVSFVQLVWFGLACLGGLTPLWAISCIPALYPSYLNISRFIFEQSVLVNFLRCKRCSFVSYFTAQVALSHHPAGCIVRSYTVQGHMFIKQMLHSNLLNIEDINPNAFSEGRFESVYAQISATRKKGKQIWTPEQVRDKSWTTPVPAPHLSPTLVAPLPPWYARNLILVEKKKLENFGAQKTRI